MSQIKDLTLKAVLDGTEKIPIQEAAGGDGSTKNATTQSIADLTTAVPPPSGSIIQYAGSSNPSGWIICIGETIGNAVSGADYAGATYETLFDILKTGWGNAGTEVFADGDTVLLPDLRGMFLRGTGTNGSLTMADTNAYAGPAVGASENDQSQGFDRYAGVALGSTGSVIYATVNVGVGISSTFASPTAGASGTQAVCSDPIDDGTNGAPRTGDETRPVSYGINYIIKI